MHKAYLGTDPGAKGAICALVPGSPDKIVFIDFKKPPIEILAWLKQVVAECIIQNNLVEEVHSIYGMSARSNFGFGWNVGIPHTLFNCIGLEPYTVEPKIWQKEVGVTAKGKAIKKNVAELCETLYPGCDIRGPKGGLLDGRSDALMIAHYGYLTIH